MAPSFNKIAKTKLEHIETWIILISLQWILFKLWWLISVRSPL